MEYIRNALLTASFKVSVKRASLPRPVSHHRRAVPPDAAPRAGQTQAASLYLGSRLTPFLLAGLYAKQHRLLICRSLRKVGGQSHHNAIFLPQACRPFFGSFVFNHC